MRKRTSCAIAVPRIERAATAASASQLGSAFGSCSSAKGRSRIDPPSMDAAVAALSILGTAMAQLVLFRMLLLHGAARTSLVTYLMPPLALVYGVVLLEEPLTAAALAGLALILPGVALGSGAVRLLRRRGRFESPDQPEQGLRAAAAGSDPGTRVSLMCHERQARSTTEPVPGRAGAALVPGSSQSCDGV